MKRRDRLPFRMKLIGDRQTKGEKMNDETIEAEVIGTSKAIVVTRTPIIAYEMLKPISESITAKIAALNIESLEPTEENLAVIKKTRTDLKKDFDDLENARKMAKELRMLTVCSPAVRGRVLRSVPERRRIQTAV